MVGGTKKVFSNSCCMSWLQYLRTVTLAYNKGWKRLFGLIYNVGLKKCLNQAVFSSLTGLIFTGKFYKEICCLQVLKGNPDTLTGFLDASNFEYNW